MTTTPPTRTRVVQPPAPLYGSRYDTSLTSPKRRSLRTCARQENKTPSPGRVSASRTSPILRGPTSFRNLSPSSSDLGSPSSKSKNKNHSTTMLPTPTKTPSKREALVKPPNRKLFPVDRDAEESTPRINKRGKRLVDWSKNDDDQIQIFEDTRDKQPKLDLSKDNPFYIVPGVNDNQEKKNSEVHDAVGDMLEAGEGLVYVFRGKRIFKPFSSKEKEAEEITDDEYQKAEAHLGLDKLKSPKRATRSTTKASLLKTVSDDEASTDIEAGEKYSNTPTKHAPATPPRTVRTKRTANFEDSLDLPDTPSRAPKVTKKARTGAFASWPRTKGTSTSQRGTKRNATEMDS